MPNWKDASVITPIWDREKDKTIEGVLVEKLSGIGQNNSNKYVIEKKSLGKISVWGTSVLDLRLQPLPIGTIIKITYLGTVKGKGPKPYHNFEVLYDADTLPEKDLVAEAEKIFGTKAE